MLRSAKNTAGDDLRTTQKLSCYVSFAPLKEVLMKGDNVKKYALDAFRFYAKTGGSVAYKTKIKDDAMIATKVEVKSGGKGSPTEAAIIRVEKALEDAHAQIADLEAVEGTINLLSKTRPDIVKAITIVYMTHPEKRPAKGDIQGRVARATIEIPASERSVYSWLSIAREAFARRRGLRVD